MRIAFDAAAIPTTRRLRVWRDLICDTYVNLDSFRDDGDFYWRATGHRIDDHTFTRVTSSSLYQVERSRTQIRRDGLELLFFGFALSGRFAMKQVVDPRCIAFNNSTRPFRTDFGADVEMGWLAVPKKALEDRVGAVEDLSAVAFRPVTAIQQVAFDFLSGLGRVLDSGVSQADAAALVDQAVDLIATMIRGDAVPSSESAVAALRATRLRRLKSHLDDNLHRADLSVATAAAALSLSPGQIDSLFAREATTFGHYVMTRRLEGCRAFLSSRVPLQRSVEDVAAFWGFADSDDFSNAFEERFGTSPSDPHGAP